MPIHSTAKIFTSLILGVIAALVFVLAYEGTVIITWFDYVKVFVGAAGFDALVKRAIGTVSK